MTTNQHFTSEGALTKTIETKIFHVHLNSNPQLGVYRSMCGLRLIDGLNLDLVHIN